MTVDLLNIARHHHFGPKPPHLLQPAACKIIPAQSVWKAEMIFNL